ncbi:MAG: enoyl-CoA hydratase/isomerase family protein [Candidatus Thorarchaeota archaeon]|jgi:enoyl-CoA hydratase
MVASKYWIVKEEEEGQIVWLLLNRPDKRNAFNHNVLEELEELLNGLDQNEKIRVLVISTALDNIFSAGADIESFLEFNDESVYNDAYEMSKLVQRAFSRLESLPFPVISAAKGLTLTAALELSICCDMIVAADNARFGQIETKYGIIPGGGGTQRLIRLVGSLKARELIYTCDVIDADEALRIGLVNHIVPVDELDNFVLEVCRKIIRNSKRAISKSKDLINKATYVNAEGFAGENQGFGEVFASGEPKERLTAFIESSKKKK